MVLRLAERLDVPLGERNALLTAAGFAPIFPEHRPDAPALRRAMDAVGRILDGHAPFPALAVDARWNLLRANAAAEALMAGAAPALTAAPVNVLRLSLHPAGLAGRIVNFVEWRAHVLERLRRQIERSGDGPLEDLRAELAAYPLPPDAAGGRSGGHEVDAVVTPLRLRADDRVLSFLGTTTVFGTALEVTLEGVVIESFFPADDATAAALGAGSGAALPDREPATAPCSPHP